MWCIARVTCLVNIIGIIEDQVVSCAINHPSQQPGISRKCTLMFWIFTLDFFLLIVYGTVLYVPLVTYWPLINVRHVAFPG